GPYHPNRVIDVSVRAAKLLGFYDSGVGQVRVEYVGRAALEGSDDRQLAATLRHNEPAPAPSLVMVASAKPFVPEAGGGVPYGGSSIPVPAERPFRLGQSDGQALPSGRTSETAVAARVPAATMAPAAEEADSSVAASPVSAFAPPRYDTNPNFMSGRGLY